MLLFAVGLLWLAGAPAQAATTADRLNEGRTEFAKWAQGDDTSADSAWKIFKSLEADDPRNPLVLAYLGACSGLKARDSWMPWNKMRFADSGVDYLDNAMKELDGLRQARAAGVEQLGAEVTLVAASAYLAFPKNYNRYNRGRSLLLGMVDGPAFNYLPPLLKVQYLNRAMDLANRESDTERENRYRERMVALGAGG